MILLRTYLILAWLLIVGISIWALKTLGLDGANVFITDYAHPWRAQFYTDFSLHVILVASWVFWREQSKIVGLLCVLGALLGGSCFTLLYVLIASYRAGGDARRLLLGGHA